MTYSFCMGYGYRDAIETEWPGYCLQIYGYKDTGLRLKARRKEAHVWTI